MPDATSYLTRPLNRLTVVAPSGNVEIDDTPNAELCLKRVELVFAQSSGQKCTEMCSQGNPGRVPPPRHPLLHAFITFFLSFFKYVLYVTEYARSKRSGGLRVPADAVGRRYDPK